MLESIFWRFIESLVVDSDAAVHDWIADLRGHELVSDELTGAAVANLGEWIGVVTAALSEG